MLLVLDKKSFIGSHHGSLKFLPFTQCTWECVTCVPIERGIVKECRDRFPIVDLHDCLFHLFQSIYRRVQSVGLAERYIKISNLISNGMYVYQEKYVFRLFVL